jgi:hypothetical protein
VALPQRPAAERAVGEVALERRALPPAAKRVVAEASLAQDLLALAPVHAASVPKEGRSAAR